MQTQNPLTSSGSFIDSECPTECLCNYKWTTEIVEHLLATNDRDTDSVSLKMNNYKKMNNYL
jgi:hypothetical protein